MDTVILKIIGPGKFQINKTKYSHFLPEITERKYEKLSESEKKSKRNYLRKFVLQIPHQDRYFPRLRVYEKLASERKRIYYLLEIECSVPKLLYGNSLLEADDRDREKFISRLKSALYELGIRIQMPELEQARISAVHFCKNIPLPDNIKVRQLLNELAKVDLSKVYEITGTKIKDGGRVLNYYSGTIEWSFYDKIIDAARPKNKRVDKNYIEPERLFSKQNNLQEREVFRYEYRIKKYQTVMREINNALGREPKTPVTLDTIFSQNLCKTVANNSWKRIIQQPGNQLALFEKIDSLQLLIHVFAEAGKDGQKAYSLNNALISYGLARVIQDHGAKEVRKVIFEIWNTDHPERLLGKIKMAAGMIDKLPVSNSISILNKALEEFTLIDLASLKRAI